MQWVETIQFEIDIHYKSIFFNIKDFFGIFSSSEIKFIFENLRTLERQQHEDYIFPIEMLEWYRTKLSSSKTNDIKQKIEKIILDFTKLYVHYSKQQD